MSAKTVLLFAGGIKSVSTMQYYLGIEMSDLDLYWDRVRVHDISNDRSLTL